MFKIKKFKLIKTGRKKGFTLLELLTVVAIISILSTFFFAGYRSGDKTFRLQRAANKLASDIRRAGELAMSGKNSHDTYNCAGPPATSYGIYVDSAAIYYILYADTQGSYVYTSGQDCTVETINLEKGIVVQSINVPPQKVHINFKPPDPQIKIKGSDEVGSVAITLSLENDPTKTKTVIVNTAGLIDID